MISLLDVNVLIALIVQDHPFHEGASAFFKQALANGWATCPLTENAVLRIVAGGSLSGPTPTVQEMREQFAKYLAMPGHQFWPDDVSLTAGVSPPSIASSTPPWFRAAPLRISSFLCRNSAFHLAPPLR